MHNATVKFFLLKNNIDEVEVSSKVNTTILSIEDVDSIFADYGIFETTRKQKVSIGDIYGFDYKWRETIPDIFKCLDDFFDEMGDGYHSRSCEEFLMPPEEMLASDSFQEEPIDLINLDSETGLYLVSNNGLHRYTALRTLYLSELAQAPEKEQELREKYTIEVSSKNIDLIKTYCNFIISNSIEKSYIRNELDNNYCPTGNSILITEDGKKTVTDEELLEFTRNVANNNPEFINEHSATNQRFKAFIDSTLYQEKNKEVTNG